MALAPVKTRVLVMEDQPEIATVIEILLRRMGFDVAIARTGPEAIRLARHDEFDLITLDIDVPEMNGFEVCRCLKDDFRFARTPVIFVSGRSSGEDKRRGFEVGAADFIGKPFDSFTFVSRILWHLNRR